MNGLRFIWNDEWRHPTESCYGIASKLAIANCITIEDALPLCGAPSKSAPYWEWHASSQIGIPEEGSNSLSNTGGPSVYEPFYQYSLRFCQQCLAVGFHAVAHQNRLLTTCPVHHVPLDEFCPRCHSVLFPPCGEPWRCGYCGFSLAIADVRTWVSAFKQYPGGRFLTWTEAEMQAYLAHSDTELPLLGSPAQAFCDYHDWELNWRDLHLCYLNELFSTTRQWFWRHSACFLKPPGLVQTMHERGCQCPVVKSFNHLVQQMGLTADGLQTEQVTKETKSAVLMHLVEPLFSREMAAYLRGKAANLVIRDLAQARFADALNDYLSYGAPQASDYKRNWHLSHSIFNVPPSASRRDFQRLSVAADRFCASHV